MKYVQGNSLPYLSIDNQIVIAAFAGFIRNRNAISEVYFRGEGANHPYLTPSLFRHKGAPLADNALIGMRWKAYTQLKKSV